MTSVGRVDLVPVHNGGYISLSSCKWTVDGRLFRFRHPCRSFVERSVGKRQCHIGGNVINSFKPMLWRVNVNRSPMFSESRNELHCSSCCCNSIILYIKRMIRGENSRKKAINSKEAPGKEKNFMKLNFNKFIIMCYNNLKEK
jgi:hypothetical protein